MAQKIRIKLKSYDHNLVDKSAEKIVKTVKSTGAVVSVSYIEQMGNLFEVHLLEDRVPTCGEC